jgi:ATP-binding cassette, subfamily B, bacterial
MKKISEFKYLSGYLKDYKLQLTGVLIALFFTSTSVLAIGYGIRYLIDGAFVKQDANLLDQALLILISFATLLAVATYTRASLIYSVCESMIARIRSDLYNHIINLPVVFFENSKTSDLITRIATDTSIINVIITSSFSSFLRNIVMLIGGVIMLVLTSIKLTIYVVMIVPMVILPIMIIGKRLKQSSVDIHEKVGLLSAYGEETINGIKTVKSYNRENYESEIFARLCKSAQEVAVKRVMIRSALVAFTIAIVFVGIAFVLWIGGSAVLNKEMSAGELSSFIFYAVLVAASLGAIGEVMTEINKATGATRRIMDIFEQPQEIIADNKYNLPNDKKTGELIFSNVNFSYPARPETLILNNFNLQIKQGEKIGIIGQSGVGKSTIFQILLGFYQINSGSITINGYDISEISVKSLRDQFALVTYDTVIFSTTIYENILFAEPNATKQEVIKALEAAECMEFINKMPQKLDSFVGEKGLQLSAGQKQRIGIARAILKNPSILLLDEATASLDVENEKLVQNALDKLMQGRTTIIITHRMSSIEDVNKIITIEKVIDNNL